jgi:hypothetical protein
MLVAARGRPVPLVASIQPVPTITIHVVSAATLNLSNRLRRNGPTQGRLAAHRDVGHRRA